MAVSRVNKVAMMSGKAAVDREAKKGVVVCQLRQRLSTAAVRAASQCLLDGIPQCGEGARLAAKRRESSVN